MEPKYKIGDIVTIKSKRDVGKGNNDYRFGFPNRMLEQCGGKSYKITAISRESDIGITPKMVPDDGHCYELEGLTFFWASSMFEDSPKKSSKKGSKEFKDIVIFTRKRKPIKFNFNI